MAIPDLEIIVIELSSCKRIEDSKKILEFIINSQKLNAIELAQVFQSVAQLHGESKVTPRDFSYFYKENLEGLFNYLVEVNHERMENLKQQEEVIQKNLINSLLDEKMQDLILKIFLKYEFSLGWVDEVLEFKSYEEKIKAIMIMGLKHFTQCEKVYSLALNKYPPKLSRIIKNKIYQESTGAIDVGLIYILKFYRELKFNYDLFCSFLESAPAHQFSSLEIFASPFRALRRFKDTQIFRLLFSCKDYFELIDACSLLIQLDSLKIDYKVPKVKNLTEFHDQLNKMVTKISMPQYEFSQEEIKDWEGQMIIGEGRIFVPTKSSDLVRLGKDLKICVGTARYDVKLVFNHSLIFFVMTEYSPRFCIELKPKDQGWDIIQSRGFNNDPLPPGSLAAIKQFIFSKK